MKTCHLLLLVAVPSWAFQQASPIISTARRRQDVAFISRPAAASAIDEPPTRSSTTSTTELPPVLQDIVNERAEFQRNLGKAMDTLRKDYPEILTRAPDYSIYHDEISVTDPSGVQLSGLSTYKKGIQFVQTLISFLYNREKSGLQFRIVYDFCRSSIRVSWHLELYPKIVGGRMFVDGISVYKMDAESGKIVEHKVENLLINNSPVEPPYGLFGMMREEMSSSPGVAVGGMC